MSSKKKWDILFIEDSASMFDTDIKVFKQLFNKVDKVDEKEKALELFNDNKYDMVISDLSVEPEKLGFLKQIQDINKSQSIFAMLSPKDTDKLYGIADLGINAFELVPEQFEQALEAIAEFDPYEEQSN